MLVEEHMLKADRPSPKLIAWVNIELLAGSATAGLAAGDSVLPEFCIRCVSVPWIDHYMRLLYTSTECWVLDVSHTAAAVNVLLDILLLRGTEVLSDALLVSECAPFGAPLFWCSTVIVESGPRHFEAGLCY